MSTSDTRAFVTQYLQALAARDLPALLACFAENVDWDVPGARELAPWVGPRQHRAQVQQFFELLFAHTVPVSAQVEHLVTEGEVAVVSGTFASTMTSTGRLYTSRFFLQMTVQQGHIVQYRLLEDTWALVLALARPSAPAGPAPAEHSQA